MSRAETMDLMHAMRGGWCGVCGGPGRVTRRVIVWKMQLCDLCAFAHDHNRWGVLLDRWLSR